MINNSHTFSSKIIGISNLTSEMTFSGVYHFLFMIKEEEEEEEEDDDDDDEKEEEELHFYL